MKTGLFSSARRDLSLEGFLDYAGELGVQMVELGCGEEAGTNMCDPRKLLSDEAAYASFQEALKRNHLEVSALSCHGNPISPNKEQAELSDRLMRNAILLAEKMGLKTIVTFSGCPGGDEHSKYINWVTVTWPVDYPLVYKWQWEEVLVPYWKDLTAFAAEHGIEHIALEMHPGQMCFNPATVKRLREDVGSDLIGANLDFSHLLWQRMDTILVIRELKGMIYHMHAKDIAFDTQRIKETGLISRTYYSQPTKRSWNFRIIGYGHDVGWWRNVFAELRRVGYEYVASIEFECELTSADYGCRMALKNLQDALLMDDADSPMAWRNHTIRTQKKRDELYGIGK